MELKDLVWPKKLDAVDFCDEWGVFGDSRIIKFRLNGILYCAVEDENDGYRSAMKEISILDSAYIRNIFPPIDVVCIYSDDKDLDLLTIFDAETEEIVLEVGTNYVDDWYPYFVSSFFPEAMIINKKVK
jgi:hypothetical protein